MGAPAVRKHPGAMATPNERGDMAKRTCSIDGCDRKHYGRSWCKMHYSRWRTNGTTEKILKRRTGCSIDGCDREHQARSWCNLHYERWRAHGDPEKSLYPEHRSVCTIEGCGKDHLSRGWCAMHYMRWREHGDPGQAEPLRMYGRTSCDVNACDEPHAALGMCDTHRQQSRRFDLTAEDLSSLNDVCPICGDAATHIDHCHDCGDVRGRLCHGCNAGNGITDDPDLLEIKAKWLRAACDCYQPD